MQDLNISLKLSVFILHMGADGKLFILASSVSIQTGIHIFAFRLGQVTPE